MMIICITGWLDRYKGGIKVDREFVVSHGINPETDEMVILPCEHPSRLGAVFNNEIGEYVIYDKGEVK